MTRVERAQLTYFASTIEKDPIVVEISKRDFIASQPRWTGAARVWYYALERPNAYPIARIQEGNVLVVFKHVPSHPNANS